MAINKTAKNIHIEIRNNYLCTAKTILEVSEKVDIVATKEKLTLVAAKRIYVKGNKS